ncbi:endonuclease III domain-containing protein [Desulfomonile tiedjei]|uniref:endonuclease III domain-containing protein n=1 Tax=Desulfomonile tiedjei TaxID=2358 RepID=UPI00059B7496
MRDNCDIHRVVDILRRSVESLAVPIVTEISRKRRDPFDVLVSTVLSLRTKDDVTRVASRRLLAVASTPEALADLPEEEIEKLIFPVGFYRTKARNLRQLARDLLQKYGGKVPDDLDELLTIKGVGRKTANLVITLGFGQQGICVDTHVHRVSNRLGYVSTKTPEQTEMALRAKLPAEYWIEYNDLLVTWGQNICRPISPFCSKCPVLVCCNQIGVTQHR